jgi:HAD superfamily hydrolase (TIGR01549 family)
MLAPDGDVATLVEHHRELHREELLYLVAAYEGLHELLAHIRMRGMKLGICTNRGRGAEDLLKQLGIFKDFDTIVTADDVKKHKPDPEGVLQALENINCAASNAVMVGDTTADIGAGKAAGVAFTIGVTHGFSDESVLREVGADYIVHHLTEVLPILEAHIN